ncbi:acyl-CoA dehydrogenase [Frankia sp. Ag45/Mut15]|uniref:Acyl-CoA dehydrogenase n=1 Tax=Frankia umida TaxID=573489 RepID=A0ABT0K203_9ACTN|nr:acyl-CoA dehydrogenase [Frankia umida]MCK9877844.1 acyl-CoA dehydrogenase [Frankia umida]
MRYPPYLVAEQLEGQLGDPREPSSAIPLAESVRLDELAEFPAAACSRLDQLGVPAFYVPARYGGRLTGLDQLLQVFRAVSRRDLTAAIAHHKTFLGCVSTWVAGEPGAAGRLAERVRAGAVVAWGLTEPGHGSDLLAGELTARPAPGGFRLDGRKWLINNATRGELITVLARTDPAGGPRAFSSLLVDKRRVRGCAPLPAEPTLGIRGADISGLSFSGTVVGPDALIGPLGGGLEITLRSLQLTRTLCAGLTLGALDRGLRIGTGFALAHRMYGRVLAELPQSARMLTETYADVLLCEALGTFAARSAHGLPGELSIGSAVSKYLVPTVGERALGRLGQLLGARAFLRNTFADGVFQKVERDHRIVGIFDGSTVVNLVSLITQFPVLARASTAGAHDQAALHATSRLAEPLPGFDPSGLQLLARGGDSVLAGLPAAAARAATCAAQGELAAETATAAAELASLAEQLHVELAAQRPVARNLPPAAFDLAERYCWIYAGAACLHLWLANRDRLDLVPDLWRQGRWLAACLGRVLAQLLPSTGEDGETVLDELLPTLLCQYRQGQLFSPLHCQLAEAAPV